MEKNEILITSLIFKKALKFILKDNEGVILKIDDKMKPMFPNVDKVILIKHHDNIKITEYKSDLDDGTLIEIKF